MFVVHIRKSHYDVYIGRPSKWGNPFSLEEFPRQVVIAKYKDYVIQNLISGLWTEDQILELDGKILGCWCKPKACHGDVLIELIQRIKNARKFGMNYVETIQRK